MFKRVTKSELNPSQRKNYNFSKIAARLADYGFNCQRLSDDWQADFLATHVDGDTFLIAKLKGRLVIEKKYYGMSIYIAFPHRDDWYVYPHDKLLDFVKVSKPKTICSRSWEEGVYSWPKPPAWALEWLAKYRV